MKRERNRNKKRSETEGLGWGRGKCFTVTRASKRDVADRESGRKIQFVCPLNPLMDTHTHTYNGLI